MRPVSPVTDSRRPFCNHCSRLFCSRPFCNRRLWQVKVTRMKFNKLLFVSRYDGNVNFTHGLGAPTRMSGPRAPTSLIRPWEYPDPHTPLAYPHHLLLHTYTNNNPYRYKNVTRSFCTHPHYIYLPLYLY